jgi:carboxylate-amine ligase
LPLIPGLCASSPILEGKKTGFKDTRLEYYKTNQKEIPEMTGKVIPENVFTKKEYYTTIFEPIQKAIKPFDTNNLLDHHFLNSRGAISRFDRNAIEIRLVDIQECPKADIAVCTFIIEVLKMLVDEKTSDLATQKNWDKEPLFAILNNAIINGENTEILNLDYLQLFGIKENCTMQQLWQHLFNLVKNEISLEYQKAIEIILTQGTLATRISNSLQDEFSEADLLNTYEKLASCLQNNELFTS